MLLNSRTILAELAAAACLTTAAFGQSLTAPAAEPGTGTYSKAEIKNFISLMATGHNVLTLNSAKMSSDPNHIALKSDQPLVEAEITHAARERDWSKEEIRDFIAPLKKTMFTTKSAGASTGLEMLTLALGYEIPKVVQFPKSASAKQFACLVAFEGPIEEPWPLDTSFFPITTGITNPERPFPSPEQVHAFLIGHESGHCDQVKKAGKIFFDLSQDYHRGPWFLRPIAHPLARLRLMVSGNSIMNEFVDDETGADLAKLKTYRAIYGDETLRAIAHARAIFALRGDLHGSPDLVLDAIDQHDGKSAKKNDVKSTARGIAGIQKLLKNSPEFLASPGETTEGMFRAIQKSSMTGEIKNPAVQKIADDFIAAFKYFMPISAEKITTEIKAEIEEAAPQPTIKLGLIPRFVSHAANL